MMRAFMPLDWNRITFTEHMAEAAAVEGQCQVVLDFDGLERVQYEITVLRALKGEGSHPFFAIGRSIGGGEFRPFGEGQTPEEAVQECLAAAGVHHRRRVKQATT
jgi:hypothetical protein